VIVHRARSMRRARVGMKEVAAGCGRLFMGARGLAFFVLKIENSPDDSLGVMGSSEEEGGPFCLSLWMKPKRSAKPHLRLEPRHSPPNTMPSRSQKAVFEKSLPNSPTATGKGREVEFLRPSPSSFLEGRPARRDEGRGPPKRRSVR